MLQYAYRGHVDVESEEIEGFEKFLESLKIKFEIEGSDDGEDFSDDNELSSNPEVTLNDAENTELDQYCEMEIEEPKWSDGTVKQEPEEKRALVASKSTAAKQLGSALNSLAPALQIPESASNELPVPQFAEITNQSTIFKRAVKGQRLSVTVSKLPTPETQPNIHRPTSETRPIAQRPVNLQQFKRITEYECLGCYKRFPTESAANEHVKTFHHIEDPKLFVKKIEKESSASRIPTE